MIVVRVIHEISISFKGICFMVKSVSAIALPIICPRAVKSPLGHGEVNLSKCTLLAGMVISTAVCHNCPTAYCICNIDSKFLI